MPPAWLRKVLGIELMVDLGSAVDDATTRIENRLETVEPKIVEAVIAKLELLGEAQAEHVEAALSAVGHLVEENLAASERHAQRAEAAAGRAKQYVERGGLGRPDPSKAAQTASERDQIATETSQEASDAPITPFRRGRMDKSALHRLHGVR